MSKRDWSEHAALGIVGLIFALFVAMVVYTGSDGIQDQQRSKTPEYAFVGDRLAQGLMTVAAFIGVIVSAWAVVLLRGTLQAALDANSGFRESAERQLRAYVACPRVEIVGPILDRLHLQPVWKNSGQTPTRNACASFGYLVARDLPDSFDYPDRRPGEYGRISLGAGDEITTNGPFISLAEWESLRSGNARIFLWGWVEYNDVFDVTPRRRSEFCTALVVTPANDEVWSRPGAHNGADAECLMPLKTQA